MNRDSPNRTRWSTSLALASSASRRLPTARARGAFDHDPARNGHGVLLERAVAGGFWLPTTLTATRPRDAQCRRLQHRAAHGRRLVAGSMLAARQPVRCGAGCSILAGETIPAIALTEPGGGSMPLTRRGARGGRRRLRSRRREDIHGFATSGGHRGGMGAHRPREWRLRGISALLVPLTCPASPQPRSRTPAAGARDCGCCTSTVSGYPQTTCSVRRTAVFVQVMHGFDTRALIGLQCPAFHAVARRDMGIGRGTAISGEPLHGVPGRPFRWPRRAHPRLPPDVPAPWSRSRDSARPRPR
jgi:hypothetical protein